MATIAIHEFVDQTGGNRYQRWFLRLDVAAATKVTTALERLAQGNRSSIKPVGKGVTEYKIDFGPGYRIYFGQDGPELILLLGGGKKPTQAADIEDAKNAWRAYKRRKKEEAEKAAAKLSQTSGTKSKKRR